MIILYSLIFYKIKYDVSKNTRKIILPVSFSFQNGGSYSFNITGNGTDSYLFQIATEKDIDQYWVDKDIYLPCSNITSNDNIHIIQIHDGKANFSGYIEKEGTYTVNIKSCTYFSSSYTIELSFKNPNSFLSLDDQNALKKYKILIYITATLYIVWLLNWFRFFSLRNIIHTLLIFEFFFYIYSLVLLYYEMESKIESDDEPQIYYKRQYIKFISNFLCFFVMQMISNQLFICIGIKKIFVYSFSFLFAFFSLFFPFYFSCYDLYMVSLVFWEIYLLTLIATFLVKTESTVFNDSYLLYMLNMLLSLVYLFFFFILQMKGPLSYYNNFLFSIFDTIYLCIIGFLFRMKETTKNQYFTYDFFFTMGSTSNYILPASLTVINQNTIPKNSEIRFISFHEDSKLKIIGDRAFSFAPYVKKIIIPSSVISIGRSAFSNCYHLQTVEFKEDSKLENIDEFAFSYSPIEYISIPKNVTEIKMSTFSDCSKLKKVNFSSSSKLKVIHQNAFKNTKIEQITLPSHVEKLNDFWCQNTPNLTDVSISSENQHFKYYERKTIISKKNKNNDDFDLLVFAPRNIEDIKIPSFIKKIATCAFSHCCRLQKVEFSENSKCLIIDQLAFAETSIKSIFIPSSVKELCDMSFQKCTKLEKIEFSNDSNLKIIGKCCFSFSSLKNIKIPSSVTNIDVGAFSFCSKLERVDFLDDSELKLIGRDAFYNCSITSFSVPPHVIKIDKGAFSDCDQLQIIEIQDNSELISINKDSFGDNMNLVITVSSKCSVNIFN